MPEYRSVEFNTAGPVCDTTGTVQKNDDGLNIYEPVGFARVNPCFVALLEEVEEVTPPLVRITIQSGKSVDVFGTLNEVHKKLHSSFA